MHNSSIRRFITTGVLAGLGAALIAAQTQPQKPARNPPRDPRTRLPVRLRMLSSQPPRFRVESNFVRVDAYPLEDGKPVFDLKAEDFEVFEDGVAQKIETFEHVVVRPAGPQTERVESSSQRESLQAAANPRNRVFVIFLDTPNVAVESAHAINEPLIRLIDRILGPDDLVAVMTPAMAASQIVLGRKTEVIEDSLRAQLAVGDTLHAAQKDEREYAYEACYGQNSALTKELIRAEAGAGDARGARGSRAVSAFDSRGTKSDPHGHRRLAALRRQTVADGVSRTGRRAVS